MTGINSISDNSLTRRGFLAGLAILSVQPAVALAHGNHGTASVEAEVLGVRSDGDTLVMCIDLVNRGPHAVTVFGFDVDGAVERTRDPLSLPAGGREIYYTELEFASEAPAIFTGLLNFGDAGQGPVLVMS
jgi:hypothetical protein